MGSVKLKRRNRNLNFLRILRDLNTTLCHLFSFRLGHVFSCKIRDYTFDDRLNFLLNQEKHYFKLIFSPKKKIDFDLLSFNNLPNLIHGQFLIFNTNKIIIYFLFI